MNHRHFHAQQVVDNDDQPKKKPIETTYQENPKVFDMEPAELHSDTDREEDTMFPDHSMQTKLLKVLTFCAGKIPIASHAISGSAHRLTTTHWDIEAQKALVDGTSNDSGNDPDNLESTGYPPLKAGTDHTNDEYDDTIEEPLPATWRTKQPLDTVSEEAMVVPKMKKISNGPRQHMKAGDFDEIS
ncbi:hypothetical protein C8R48DRAFT_768440 [Suillus tomentosus]|nr:hypothetical protein C8R48DRAFT_768440 [Suillus tomentosus]